MNRRPAQLTQDGLMGRRLTLWQPGQGYRAGADAVMLAAFVPARVGETALDVGAGVGAAGLCLARRVPSLHVSLLESEPALADLAGRNARENGLADRVVAVHGDLTASETLAGARFDQVLTNPPFHPAGSATLSPHANRQAACVEAADLPLGRWLDRCLGWLKPGGSLTLIHLAARLPDLLAALDGKVGAIVVLPLWPKAGRPAERVLLRAISGGAAGCTLLPGLVLHEADGRYSSAAEAVLRLGLALGDAAA
ncbi:MAG: methyltransferase [Alphaproteobacteria bacterium]|nr:methyltransferase [Alphaproteobacteria bacterium]